MKEAREEGRFQVMSEKLDRETAEGLGLKRCLDNLPEHFPRRDLAAVIIPEFTADGTKKENVWMRIGLGQMPASKQSMDIRGNRFHGSPMRFSESLAKDDWYLRDFAYRTEYHQREGEVYLGAYDTALWYCGRDHSEFGQEHILMYECQYEHIRTKPKGGGKKKGKGPSRVCLARGVRAQYAYIRLSLIHI